MGANGYHLLREFALECAAGGVCVVPSLATKHPALTEWKDYQRILPAPEQLDDWFSAHRKPHGIGFVCGAISGGLEVLDVDSKHDKTGTLNARAEAAITKYAPGLWERLPRERTPSGGLHLYWRCSDPEGNLKLARIIGEDGKPKTIIETRGEGGFIVAAPTPGYVLENGSLAEIPSITTNQRAAILSACKSLDRAPLKSKLSPVPSQAPMPGMRPGDDYDQRGDVCELIRRHGWQEHDKKHWVRPGKSIHDGISATWDTIDGMPRHFYVFTSNADPFEGDQLYSPFSVYTHLEHHGDFSAAAKALYAQGYGTRVTASKPLSSSAPAELNLDRPTTEDQPTRLTARGLMEFDVPSADDSNVLIGDRWLSRGDMAIMASTSGMGKSSLALQLGTLWSLGRDFYGGLAPRQPLKILVIQAEDNDGDIAEVRHSLTHALQLTVDEQAQVNSNVRIVTDRIHRGLSFRSELKHHIDDFHPDLVIINPLLAFIDGDVNSGEDVGRFVREQLNSLNEPASFAILIIHHTAKPPKEKSDRRWNEVMYDMAGSADLTNAARAIISLRPLEAEGTFNLALPKRGRRAGYTERGKTGIHHTPVTVIGLRHSKERLTLPNGKTIPLIHWEKSEVKAEFQEPKNPGGRPPKYTFDQLRKYFPLPEAEPLPPAQIHRRFTGHVGISASAFKDLCQRTAEDGFIDKMERPLGVCYRLRHHPA